MGSFKDFFDATSGEPCWFHFEIDEYAVHVLLSEGRDEGHLLNEAQHKGVPLGGKYSAQLHSAHGGQGTQHIHVYAKNNQLFAMNINGGAHDKSHQTKIPNKVADAIRQKFPNFVLPPNNFIENAGDDANADYVATMMEEG